MEHKLFAGYARQVVEPTESIPISGFGNDAQRFHTSMTEDICVTTVALSDEKGSTVLMIGMDTGIAYDPVTEPARQRISQLTGLTQDRIIMAGTHTHSGPSVGWADQPAMKKYIQQMIDAIVHTAQDALADRKEAKIYAGSLEAENLNFIKHYNVRDMTTGELSVIGDQYGTTQNKVLIDHTTQVDPTLHMVKLVREGKKDIVIANFRAHPHFTGGYKAYNLSSDFIGAFRMAIELMADCHAVYFQGACGNVNSSTRLHAERRFTTCRSHGTALAATALECLARCMKEVAPSPITTKQVRVYGEIKTVDKTMEDAARMVNEHWKKTFDRERCVELGEPYGIHSPYHAGALLANLERTKEKDGLMILNAAVLGQELAFVTFPGEMFDSISVRMEDNSPFATTLMLGYCHHHVGYLPSAAAYKYGSYEVDITRFAPGTGEMIADTYVQMLNELK